MEQVARDRELLRERISRLGGQAGVNRLEAGLAAARAAAAQTTESPPASSPSVLPPHPDVSVFQVLLQPLCLWYKQQGSLYALMDRKLPGRDGMTIDIPASEMVPWAGCKGQPSDRQPLVKAYMRGSNPASPVTDLTPHSSPTRPSAANWSPRGNPASPSRPGVAAAVTNETLAWELLYNLNHQLSSEEAEASWRDATGEADVMKEPIPDLKGMAPQEATMATQQRVRRIAEAAFWDSLASESHWTFQSMPAAACPELLSVPGHDSLCSSSR